MVSGSKKDSRIKKKGKEKLVFAKDPKQAALAIIVVAIFVLNGIYMLVKYIMEQNASSTPAAQQTDSSFPMILIVLLVLAAIGGIVFTLSKNPRKLLAWLTPGASPAEKKGNDNLSKIKPKGKMVFAKDPKQAVAAVVVLVIFFGNGIYMLTKYLMEQNAQNAAVQQAMNNSASQAPEGSQELDELNSLSQEQPADNTTLNNDANDIYSETMKQRGEQMPPNGPEASQSRTPVGTDSDIEIISRKNGQKRSGKMVSIVVTSSGRENPFMPVNESVSGSFSYLPPPPETLPTNTDATKVMNTTISGILYDKYSPSAIINIEGSDYLVKRGDVINHYKVLSIGKTQVIVQLGKNIYQAGVGELLTLANVNYNTVANLNKKFGGNEISINVRKKGY